MTRTLGDKDIRVEVSTYVSVLLIYLFTEKVGVFNPKLISFLVSIKCVTGHRHIHLTKSGQCG